MVALDVIGVAGTEAPGAKRLAGVRAAKGVGAPICVFLGVSRIDDDLTREDELEASKLREAGVLETGGLRRPEVMKG